MNGRLEPRLVRKRLMERGGARSAAETSRSRLMVALDFQGLEVAPSDVRRLDVEALEIVEERFGYAWEKEIYRIYPGECEKAELVERVRRMKAAGKVRRWRFPKHRGRKPPKDWDQRIRQDIAEWCVRDPVAVPEATVMALVSNGGNFRGLVRELDAAGVELLLIAVGEGSPALEALFGAERTVWMWEDERNSFTGEEDDGKERENEAAGDSGRADYSRVA